MSELPADPVELLHHLRADAVARVHEVREALASDPGVNTRTAAWLLGAVIGERLPEAQAVIDRLVGLPPRSVCPPLPSVVDRVELLHGLVAAALTVTDEAGAVHPPWRERLRDTQWDARGRPASYRDLSEHAVVLQTALDLPDSHPAGAVLHAIASAAVLAPPAETLERALQVIQRARRRDLFQCWQGWAEAHNVVPLHRAAGEAAAGSVRLAAADEAPEAIERIVVGEAFGGQCTIAVLPSGLHLEWTGDGEPPRVATQDGDTLDPVPDALTSAERAWSLHAPRFAPIRFVFGEEPNQVELTWGG